VEGYNPFGVTSQRTNRANTREKGFDGMTRLAVVFPHRTALESRKSFKAAFGSSAFSLEVIYGVDVME